MARTVHLDAGEIRFRSSPKDRSRLARLARFFETTPSDVLRRLIAEAYARLPKRTKKVATQGE